GRLLEEVDNKIARGELKFNKETLSIEPEMSLNTLLGQEIARFNALSKDEKLEGTKTKVAVHLKDRLDQVRTLADYDKLVDELHSETAKDFMSRRPLLFAVAAPDEFADLDGTIPAVDSEYHLKANQAYNARVEFHTGAVREDFPTIGFRDQVAGLYTIS